ncbi:MAG: HAD family hydrolase [Candidatus Sericytochromatia bacterium]|nr:HAD family hydrolase [Candidatus Sericytochromatia bacterium]
MPTDLIFDLDGTLWDTTAACVTGWNQALSAQELSLRVDEALLRSLMGLTGEDIRQRPFGDWPLEQGQRVLEACFKAETDQILQTGGQLYPSAEVTLQALASRHALYLVSNCDQAYLDCFLRLHPGMAAIWQATLCHGDTGWPKDQNLHWLKENAQITQGVYIGDTHTDQQAAAAAGLDFVYAAYGFGQASEPCTTLQQLSALPELLQ